MTKQYEPCEHRHPYNLIGSEEPVYYDTPCEKCESEGKFDALIFVGVLVVFALLALWWLE
jgi:hypothetical protein